MVIKKILASLLMALVIINFVFQCKRTYSVPPGEPTMRLGEITKLWIPKKVEVKDGFTFRYRLWDRLDTAIYYITGADTFDVTTTFKKISGNKPPVILPDIISTIDDNVLTRPTKFITLALPRGIIFSSSLDGIILKIKHGTNLIIIKRFRLSMESRELISN